MPNHITTVLTVERETDENHQIEKKMWKAIRDEVTPLDFKKILPIPEGTKHEITWCKENWGTKWNAYNVRFKQGEGLAFDTAWEHPYPVILALSKQYPDLTFQVATASEDRGYGVELYWIRNGEKGVIYKPTQDTWQATALSDVIRMASN